MKKYIININYFRFLMMFVGGFLYADQDSDKEFKEQYLLHYAVRAEIYDEVVRLLEQGFDINAPARSGSTPLHYAAQNNNDKIAQLLIERGADINKLEDGSKYSPLLTAAYWGSYEVAKLLVNAGASLNIKGYWYSVTALHQAVYYGYDKIAKLLIDAGADLNCSDSRGATPLHYASIHQQLNGADIFLGIISPVVQINPKYWIDFNKYKVAKLLIDAGAIVDIQDKQGNTPLFYAVEAGIVKVVDLLLKSGARIDIINNEGRTVFAYTKNKKISKLLHKHRRINASK